MRRRLTKAQRKAFYDLHRGDAEFPLCHFCLTEIRACEPWVVSHTPIPNAWDGTETGIAHARCNALYWAKVEAPMLAKGQRQYDLAHDLKVSRDPLPGGKDDPRRKKIDGTVVDRRTGKPWRSK